MLHNLPAWQSHFVQDACAPTASPPVPPEVDWAPIRRAVEELRGAGLVARIVTGIRQASDWYATAVTERELAGTVTAVLAGPLDGLAGRRLPGPEDLRRAREYGALRASQGVPPDAVLQVYYLGHQEFWAALTTVLEREAQPARLLLAAFDLGLRWVHALAEAVMQGHREQATAVAAALAVTGGQLLEEVQRVAPDYPRARELAEALRLDPDGDFHAVAVRVQDESQLHGLVSWAVHRHATQAEGSIVPVLIDDASGIVVLQGAVTELLLRHARGMCVGVGLQRAGLRGLRESLTDAHRAVALAEPERPVRFEDAWLQATLAAEHERLAPLLATAAQVASRQPHLAEAVLAYATAGFSTADAARAMLLQPNSVKYRLERWRALTGWDPRTAAGLLPSLHAISSVRAGAPRGG